ncbi:H/ACA ribonucleoprotein complex subunit Gar1/Naf1 [Macrophomina phaseolina MS6]|uniref:H/ACA ribonucleoprotein complex non-core subunit NAF1 n=2 Tax=Macrophomina phaseolina TaxID=35725 RepID=K2RY58_MACPH|nr:H/ACA ribonucleoprotein complex subunit Gar1/Naf1 [Macrophomina phaseolina MS6]
MSYHGGIPGLGLLSSDQPQLDSSAKKEGPAAQTPPTSDPAPAITSEDTLDDKPAALQSADHASNVQHLGQQLEESSLQATTSVKKELSGNGVKSEGAEDKSVKAEKQGDMTVKKEDHCADTSMAEDAGLSASPAGGNVDAVMADVNSGMLERKPKVDPEFLEAAEANKSNPNAEWQFDSSDAESSDDSDTSSDTSSEEESDDDEYPLLDPAEQARILMQEEYGDEDGGKGTGAQLRTANEVVEQKIEKPDVTVTPEMAITELGNVESVVDNMILIKANTSGEYQVLESGSVLCKDDKTVIGAVADTLGRVQEPLYTVAFNSGEEINEAGLSKGLTIYYVNDHSTYVFTQPLKNLKGTDASNQFDEEVGENEIEFSDDEAEAEYKRQLKQKKRAAHEEKNGSRGGGKANQQQPYTGALSYDDDGTDMYTPIKRPDNLHHQMMGGAPVEEQPGSYKPHRGGRGRRGGRGAGGRGGASTQHPNGLQQHPPQPQVQPQQSMSFVPPPPPQMNPAYPQQVSSPFQFNSPQAYSWQQNTGTPFTFGANQPTSPAPSNFPAGAFVNPAFFQGQQQPHSPRPFGSQMSYQAPQQPAVPPQWTPQQAADAWRMVQAMAAAQASGNSGQGQSQNEGQNHQGGGGANTAAAIQELLRALSNQNSSGGGQ